MSACAGKYSFSTSHEPAWHYHQFLEAPLSILQYHEVKQGQADAPIVWPKQFATCLTSTRSRGLDALPDAR